MENVWKIFPMKNTNLLPMSRFNNRAQDAWSIFKVTFAINQSNHKISLQFLRNITSSKTSADDNNSLLHHYSKQKLLKNVQENTLDKTLMKTKLSLMFHTLLDFLRYIDEHQNEDGVQDEPSTRYFQNIQ